VFDSGGGYRDVPKVHYNTHAYYKIWPKWAAIFDGKMYSSYGLELRVDVKKNAITVNS